MSFGAALVLAAAAGSVAPYPDPYNDKLPVDQQWTGKESAPEIYEKTMLRADLCLYGAVRQFTKASQEPAETIATAAFGACSQWLTNLRNAMMDVNSTLSPKTLDALVSEYRSRRRDQLIAYALERRMKKPG